MQTRILVGAAAWLLGAATATGGSLFAVSLLGQGITGPGGLLLTPEAVNRALVSEPAESAAPSPRDTAGSSPGSSPAATPVATATGAPAPSAAAEASAPAATVLMSGGGDVMASCLAAGVYLDSWSPLSGYEVGDVSRGPAPTARVTFSSRGGTVTMVVSCSAGVPSAATSSARRGHSDD